MKTIEIPKDLLDKFKWMANNPESVKEANYRPFDDEVEFDDWTWAAFEIEQRGNILYFYIRWYTSDGEFIGSENGRYPKNGMENETYYCQNLDNDEEHAVMVLAK